MTNSVNVATKVQISALESLFSTAAAEFEPEAVAKPSSKGVIADWYGNGVAASVVKSEVEHVYLG